MKKHEQLGKEIEKEILEKEQALKEPEGSSNLYYGIIRSGKTYGATADIHEELRQGRSVYATWPIDVTNCDDRQSLLFIIRGLFMPWKKRYYKIENRENLHYINAETGEVDGVHQFNPTTKTGYIDYLNGLNHCSLYIDEAWRVIDSYLPVRDVGEARNLILVTGHKFRTVNLIAQRPMSISIYARANMNRFYKFEKLGTFFGYPRFKRSEFQEMEGENVNEKVEPISVKTYWLNKKIANSYNTHHYGDLKPLHEKVYRAFDLSYKEKIKAFVFVFESVLIRISSLYSAFVSYKKRKTR